jgi:hypothetical protein
MENRPERNVEYGGHLTSGWRQAECHAGSPGSLNCITAAEPEGDRAARHDSRMLDATR